MGLLRALHVPLRWREVAKQTWQKVVSDNVLGWAAELAYYFFLALFPSLLLFLAIASFFPIHNLVDQVLSALSRFAPTEVLVIVRDQMLQISKNNNGGLLTFGILGTIWSASSGMSAVINTLNQSYHVSEARSWWRVRVTAILLTLALAVFVLVSFALVLVGPALAEQVAAWVGLGKVFVWIWKIVQWPFVLALMITGIGIVYYVAPDVQQSWVWITPGAVFATSIWLLISLGFKWYVAAFANYQKTYGTIGAVIVALLWFYVSGLAILVGAEMNAVIEHASPEGKDPGERVAGEKEAARAQLAQSFTRMHPQSARGSLAARRRTSDLIIGVAGVALELAVVAWSRARRSGWTEGARSNAPESDVGGRARF